MIIPLKLKNDNSKKQCTNMTNIYNLRPKQYDNKKITKISKRNTQYINMKYRTKWVTYVISIKISI